MFICELNKHKYIVFENYKLAEFDFNKLKTGKRCFELIKIFKLVF